MVLGRACFCVSVSSRAVCPNSAEITRHFSKCATKQLKPRTGGLFQSCAHLHTHVHLPSSRGLLVPAAAVTNSQLHQRSPALKESLARRTTRRLRWWSWWSWRSSLTVELVELHHQLVLDGRLVPARRGANLLRGVRRVPAAQRDLVLVLLPPAPAHLVDDRARQE
eukprot:scaffold42611_cov64-Phaeocystis_antarctica.AAC.1